MRGRETLMIDREMTLNTTRRKVLWQDLSFGAKAKAYPVLNPRLSFSIDPFPWGPGPKFQ